MYELMGQLQAVFEHSNAIHTFSTTPSNNTNNSFA